MNNIAWQTTHSMDSRASLPFVWAYMTNVANWDDPPARFELEGPFTAGARGMTRMPGQEPWHWQLTRVSPLESYVLETELDGAVMTFEWRFDGIPGGTRLRQDVLLKGLNAAAYMSQVTADFGANLAAGMRRVAAAIEQAEARGRLSSNAEPDFASQAGPGAHDARTPA